MAPMKEPPSPPGSLWGPLHYVIITKQRHIILPQWEDNQAVAKMYYHDNSSNTVTGYPTRQPGDSLRWILWYTRYYDTQHCNSHTKTQVHVRAAPDVRTPIKFTQRIDKNNEKFLFHTLWHDKQRHKLPLHIPTRYEKLTFNANQFNDVMCSRPMLLIKACDYYYRIHNVRRSERSIYSGSSI